MINTYDFKKNENGVLLPLDNYIRNYKEFGTDKKEITQLPTNYLIEQEEFKKNSKKIGNILIGAGIGLYILAIAGLSYYYNTQKKDSSIIQNEKIFRDNSNTKNSDNLLEKILKSNQN